jgi:hypothetical protein
VDEIKLFEELQPPPLPDAVRMREAARARLAAATSAPQTHPARRRSTVVAVATAAAVVAGGTGYGLTAARGGSSGAGSPTTVAGLTAVHGCPGQYITAGTLEKVSGRRATIQTGASNRLATVATSASTVITRPVSGTVSDITDGSRVFVQGTWSGRRLAARKVGIEAALPRPAFPHPQGPVRRVGPPKGALPPPVAIGTVVHAHWGSFTVVMSFPFGFGSRRVRVITSNSTEVLTRVSASLSQLGLGSNVVAVGRIGRDRVLRASAVAEPSVVRIVIGSGLVRLRPSSCSASAITTAAILASG